MTNRAMYRELAAAAILTASYPFDLLESRLRRYQPRWGDAIVLIHGFGGDRSNLLPVAAYLRMAGLVNVEYFEYSPQQSLAASVAKLLELVERLADEYAAVHVAGHSLGGVIARESARRVRPGTVRSLVTLGSPYDSNQLSPRELAIFGEEDPLIPVPHPETLRPEAFKRTVVLPATGHFALLYHPRTLQSLLSEIRINRTGSRAA